MDPVLANQVIEESSTPTEKIEEPEQEIFETKLGEMKREPKGQHLSKDEIEKKAKELAEERRKVEKLEAERQRLEEERKKINRIRNTLDSIIKSIYETIPTNLE